MVLDVAGEMLLDVETVKKKVKVVAGALALNATTTGVPALMLQLLIRKMVIPLAVALPAPPFPAVPACIQLPPSREIFVGTDVRVVDGMMVTEALLEPASAPTELKLSLEACRR